jgi:hypothetical protein
MSATQKIRKNQPVPTQPNPQPVQNLGSTDLITLAQEFKNDPQQIKLIQWFQASTGKQKQAEFAVMWRNGQQQPRGIDFVQVFRSYRKLPHQDIALKWLQDTTQPKTYEGLVRMWRQSFPAATNTATNTDRIRLKVPFYPQTDNRFEPMRTCNTSCCAMVAKFLGAKLTGDDDYYPIVRKYGDTTDHSAQTRALEEIGIASTWHTDLGFSDLDASLAAQLPIVIGILHRGSLAAPTGGHMIVVIGLTRNGDYICHDPFGSLLDPQGGYTGNVQNGNGVVYGRSLLERRWLPEGPRSGWGRLFYARR